MTDTALVVRAGTRAKFNFDLREAYGHQLGQIRKLAQEAAEKADLDPDQLAKQIEIALADSSLPEELFDQFPGRFIVHRPSIGETIEIDNQTATLTNQLPPTALRARGGNLAQMCATLRVVVDKGPDWYQDPLDLYEPDVISLIFLGWKLWVDSFRF